MAIASKQFRRIQTTDNTINLIQDQLEDLFKQIGANPWVFGKPIYQVAFVAGANFVSHGLGRNFVSCFVGIPTGTAFDGLFGSGGLALDNVQTDRSQFVVLDAVSACVADLFIF